MSFFESDADPRIELARMVELAQSLLANDPDEAYLSAAPFREDLLTPMLPYLRSGALPPCALALAAGGCASFASIKSHPLRPYWSFAFSLGEIEEPTAAEAPSPMLVAMADRVALLGAGDRFWSSWVEDRAQLFVNQQCGMPWRAMMLACDVVLGCSRDALEPLVELAREHPRHVWLAFLAETAERVAGAPEVHEAEPREPLAHTRRALEVARGPLDAKTMRAATKAWAKLAARPPLPEPETEVDEPELRSSILADAESDGPFRGFMPPERSRKALLASAWPLLVGFRRLYGLELVTEAIVRATSWLGSEMASA